MKILHLLSSSKYAGAENVAINIIKNYKNDYEGLYVSPKGDIINNLKNEGISNSMIDSFNYFRIKEVINKVNPDIVHAHDFKATIISSILFRKKTISHIHQNPEWLNKVSFRLVIFILSSKFVNKIIFVSNKITEGKFIRKLIKPHKYLILENISDKKNILSKSKQFEVEDKYDCIFIGRLTPIKDPVRFIKIISLIRKRKKNIKAVIVGDGALYNKCIQLINDLNLEKNIDLVGFQDNPYPYLRASKILIMTSKSEGLPMVINEAQILSKPLVLPDIEAFKSEKYNGCGVVCSSNIEYTEKVIRLIEDTEFYDEKSISSSKIANENNIDNYISRLIAVYEG